MSTLGRGVGWTAGVGAALLVTLVLWFLHLSRVTIAPDLVVVDRVFSDDFDLIDTRSGDVVVAGVEGWMVSPRYVLGSSEGYFAYDRACRKAKEFTGDAREFYDWVHAVGEHYDYGKEEGTADLFSFRTPARFRGVAAVEHCPAGKG